MINLESVIEFYITNQCNLACTNCNRFNDHDFQGHYYWHNYADEIKAWSHRITAPNITIIGGEPTLHPELETWAANLRKLWPDSNIMIQSNGTNISVERKVNFWEKYRVGWGISVHRPSMRPSLQRQWGMVGGIHENYEFTQSAVIAQDGVFTVHNSRPESAFNSCSMRHSHTLFKGKLYKCPVMAVLPEFRTQQNVIMDPRQEALLEKYHPLSADCSDESLTNFVLTRYQPIDQCEFCPGDFVFTPVVFHKRKKGGHNA